MIFFCGLNMVEPCFHQNFNQFIRSTPCRPHVAMSLTSLASLDRPGVRALGLDGLDGLDGFDANRDERDVQANGISDLDDSIGNTIGKP